MFRDLADVLRAGDLVVANDSATLPAAVTAQRQDGQVDVHFSTKLRRAVGRRAAAHHGPRR